MKIELSPLRSLVKSIQITYRQKKESPFFKDLPAKVRLFKPFFLLLFRTVLFFLPDTRRNLCGNVLKNCNVITVLGVALWFEKALYSYFFSFFLNSAALFLVRYFYILK